MALNFAFTVDVGQGGQEVPSNIEQRKEAKSSSAQAWDINFASTTDQGAAKERAKKTSLPKFLRDRERNRLSSAESSKSSTAKPGRSSSTPLKAKDPKPVAKPIAKPVAKPPSKATIDPLRHSKSPPQLRYNSGQTSPKKSPTIKKPLLPVVSPTRKAELRSKSECSLSVGTTGSRGKGSGTKRTRPHSAMPSLGHQRESTDGQAAMDSGRSIKGRQEQSGVIDAEVPRVSKSLPAVTLSHTPDSSTLATTPNEMSQRKVLELKRWYCMCHPQYSMSCGISSVVSCWNYLFSTLGNGSLPPLTQEDALTLLGFKPPFGEIKFGPFTGNITCMRWFQRLCNHFGVTGQAYYFWKPVGRRRTAGINSSMALERLQEGLRNANMSFIYHCSNHYFCPIGYELVPRKATDAYRVGLRPDQVDTWVLIGEPSRTMSAIHCVKWTNVVKDLTCESPKHFNIRHIRKGIIIRNTKRKGGNIHCLMALKKVEESVTINPFEISSDVERTDGEEVSESEVEDLLSSDSDYPDAPIHQTNKLSVNLDFEGFDCSNLYLPNHHEAKEQIFSSVKRSNTFTKDGPSVRVKQTRQPSSDSDLSIDSEEDTGNLTTGATPPASNPSVNLEFEGHDGSGIYPSSHHKTKDSVQIVSSVKRSDTFTKDGPSVQIKLTRQPSSDSDLSIDSEEGTGNLTRISTGATPPADSASGLQRSGTFTKDAPTVFIQRTSAWSSEEDNSDTSLTMERYDNDAEGVTDAAHRTHATADPTSEQARFVGAKDDDCSISSSEDCAPPQYKLRSETFTKEEPTVSGGVDICEEDLDDTLKASDFAKAAEDWNEDLNEDKTID